MKKFLLLSFIIFSLSSSGYSQLQSKDTEWDDFFMPGVGYKTYIPKRLDSLGSYQGIMTEFVIYARAKGVQSKSFGPSRIKTYGNLSIMSSDNKEVRDIFFANLGVNLSFEAKTDRKYILPYFGLEIGGLFKRSFSTFQFSPIAGIQIFSSKSILWNIQGGYQYTTKSFDAYSGYILSSTLNVLLWNN